MNKKRWKIGSFELNYNPNTYTQFKTASASPVVTAKGIVSSPNTYYETKDIFTIDIFNKHSYSNVLANINTATKGISQDLITDKFYIIDNTNSIKVADESGSLLSPISLSYTDYCLNKAVAATGLEGSSLTDGFYDTTWYMGTGTREATIDMSSSVTINKIKLYIAESGAGGTTINIQKSIDGSTYTTIFSVGAINSIGIQEISISPVEVRYLKITISNYSGTTNRLIGEVSAYYIPDPNNAVGIVKTSNEIIIAYRNNSSSGIVFKYDEFGNEIRKYVYNDADIMYVNSIAWDFSNGLYLLNQYGKVFYIDLSNGGYSMVYQSDDFILNKSNNKPIYLAIYLYARDTSYLSRNISYFGIVKENKLIHLDYNFNIVQSIDIYSVEGIYYNIYNKNTYTINSLGEIRLFYPNISKLQVDNLKKELSAGSVIVVDENNFSKKMLIKDIDIQRLRNKEEARFRITISGVIM